MANPIIPAAVAAGAGIGSSLIAGRQSRKNMLATVRGNKALAEYQYSKELEMWERSNQYNSPANQMRLLAEAGLNPHMIYGHGTQASRAAELPRYNRPTVDYQGMSTPGTQIGLNLPTMIGQYQDFQLRQAQIDNLKAQEQNTRVMTNVNLAREVLIGAQGRKTSTEAELAEFMRPYQAGARVEETRQSVIRTEQELKRLSLLGQDQQLKSLEALRSQKSLQLMDIEGEQKAADLIFSQFRNQWMAMGVTSSDNVLLRIFVRMLTESGLNPSVILGK